MSGTCFRSVEQGVDAPIRLPQKKIAEDREGRLGSDFPEPRSRAIAYGVDLGREDEAVALFAALDAEFGPISGFVDNAGVIGWEGRVEEASTDRLNHLWAVNVTSYFICAREAVRRMSTANGGSGGAPA